MTRADSIIRVRELIGEKQVAMITSTAPNGELHSRPITLCELDDKGSLWFLVTNEADWVKGMQAGAIVNAAFADDDDKTWVSVAGNASVHYDEAKIDRLWNPMAEIFFPGGKSDPELRLLSIDASTVEYWDAPSSRIKRLAMMAKGAIGSDRPEMGESGTINMG